ncbi:MAG: DUF4421 domain-containing protein [Spirochaetes bacterium]|nr:DUF4421 domain-containing protein [Spirochaetota bacterium]
MNKCVIFLCLFIFALLPKTLLPQESTSSQNNDSAQIKTFENDIIFRAYISRPFLTLALRHYPPKGQENLSQPVRYVPNTLAHWGASISWLGFGLSLGFDSPKSEKDETQYGNTKYYDFQISFYGSQYGFDAYYQNYKGFYLLEPDKYGYRAGSAEALRDDIAAKTIGCNIFIAFFEEFSFSAAFDQSQRQISSACSPVVMISFNRFSIESNRSIIVPSQEIYYGEFTGYRGGDYTGLAIVPGIAATYLFFTYCYISGVIFIGSGLMHKEYTTAAGGITENKPFGKLNLRVSIGYNDDELFGGIQGRFDFTASERTFRRDLNEEMTEVIATTGNIEIFFGKRL